MKTLKTPWLVAAIFYPLYTGAWITPSDGTIEFEMKLKTETHCPLTFTKFPFDSQVSYARLSCSYVVKELMKHTGFLKLFLFFQKCLFVLGSFAYPSGRMSFSIEKVLYHDHFQATQLDYEVTGLETVSNHSVYFGANLERYSLAGFELTFQRYFGQYLLDYYLPTSLFVCVSWVSFLIPVNIIPG